MEKILTKENWIIFSILLLFGFLLFYKIGLNYLTHWDEAWHADVSRNVAKTGDLIKLRWNAEPFFDKPPLYFWFSALSMKLFGFTEFAARLPSVASGLGTGILLYLTALKLFNKQVAFLSLLIISSTIGFLFRVRTGNLDGLLTFLILASIFSFYNAYHKRSVRWFVILGVILGLGFLTKGAVIFVFPLICLVYLLIRKEYHLLGLKFLTGSILIGTFISLSWIFASFLSNGEAFIEGFFANQIGKVSTTSSFWRNFSLEYIGHLKSGLKIWFAPFLVAFLYSLFKWRDTKTVILSAYFFLLFLVLSFSENKSNWFLMPLYPIAALMIGYTFYELMKKFHIPHFFGMAVFFIAVLQLFTYRNEFIVPDISGDDARVAMAARDETEKDDIVYLTNYYYPTIVYYSDRKTYAVYSEHEKNDAWWVKSKTEWENILEKDRVFIITTDEEVKNFNTYFSKYNFQLLYQSGTKKLLKKV